MDTQLTKEDFMRDFLLGGVSGALAKTLTAPIERVKLVFQLQDANPKIRSGEIPRYSSLSNCFGRLYHEQGMSSFWRGNWANVLRYFPTQAFNFAFKDSIKTMFPQYNHNSDFGKFFMVQMAAGAIAGTGSLCLVYPLDYARTRLGADMGKGQRDFNGIMDCMAKTAKGPKGVLGLYAGFGVSVMGIFPYRGIYFGMYDALKEKNPWKKEHGFVGIFSKFCVAQFTELVAGYAAYPFDTVRRRLQMQSEKPKEQWLYKGTGDCFSKIRREEGWRSYFKGAGTNALRGIGSALVLIFYDEFQSLLAKQ